MKNSFYCKNCNKKFDAEGIKKEYTDPVFGPCFSYHAFCPECNMECEEYYKLRKFKSTVLKTVPPSGNSNIGCSCQQ